MTEEVGCGVGKAGAVSSVDPYSEVLFSTAIQEADGVEGFSPIIRSLAAFWVVATF